MRNEREEAANIVGALAVGGILAIGLGMIIAIFQWPDTEGLGEGSAGLAYFGLAIIALGQLALFAAVVAWAVRLGLRWSGLADELGAAIRRGPVATNGPAIGAGPVTRKRATDLSGIQPLDPRADGTYLDEDGR